MTYADLRAVFLRLSKRSGIDATPYTLRHTSLTLLAKAKWSPDRLQLRAGHRHFQTTVDTYLHLDDEDLRREWERTRTAEALALEEGR
jgi:integrase